MSHKYSITLLCKYLNISRSSIYYKHKDTYLRSDIKHSKLIYQIWLESNKNYGAPKIKHSLLRNFNISIGYSRLYRLMKQNDIKCIYHKRFKPYPKDNYFKSNRINLVNQDFTSPKPNSTWFTDITYIKYNGGFCYLNVILDSFDKSIISWKLSKNIDSNLTVDTLKAAKSKYYSDNPIIHSDQGSQYTSLEYSSHMSKFNFTQSFSKPGCPYDNAIVECFFSYFKRELIYRLDRNIDFNSLYLKIKDYIYFYQNKRIHSSLNYKTPIEFRNLYFSSKKIV